MAKTTKRAKKKPAARTQCPAVGCGTKHATAKAMATHLKAKHAGEKIGVTTAGRPKIEIDLRMVHELAMIQCTHAEIAAVLGVSEDTITNRIKADHDFSEMLKRGKEVGKSSLRRLQWAAAQKGDRTMLVWLGKNILGQRDAPQEMAVTVHHTDADAASAALIEGARRRRIELEAPGDSVH